MGRAKGNFFRLQEIGHTLVFLLNFVLAVIKYFIRIRPPIWRTTQDKMGKIWIGTSGYQYEEWRKGFYPECLSKRKWLEYYSRRFNTVEINATFYGSFKKATFQRWGGTVPEDFLFSLKGPRFITQIKRLKEVEESVARFLTEASGLGEKLNVILWQFPSNFKKSVENIIRLEKFVRQLKKHEVPQLRQVFEFRDRSWFTQAVYELLDKARAGIVISESSKFPFEEVVIGGICYIRFHGPTSLYSSSYSKKELEKWGAKIKSWSRTSDVYCYFNNDAGGHAFRNGQELAKIVTSDNSLVKNF